MTSPRLVPAAAPPARSPARQAVADARQALEDIGAKIEAKRSAIEAADAAHGDVANAEAALRTALFEAALSPAGELAAEKRKALAAAVQEARGRAVTTDALRAEFQSLNAQVAGIGQAHANAVRAVVMEDAQRLGAAYHEAADAALGYEAALMGLASWAAFAGEDLALSQTIQSMTRAHPEASIAATLIAERREQAKAVQSAWALYPPIAGGEPDAACPSTVLQPEPSEARHAA